MGTVKVSGRSVSRVVLLSFYPKGDRYYPLASAKLRRAVMLSPLLVRGPSVDIIDLPLSDDPERSAAEIVRWSPDLLGISCLGWQVREALDVVRAVKRQLRECSVVLGGNGPEPLAAALLEGNPEVDWIVVGDGEATFPALISALERGSPIGEIPGIYARFDQGPALTAPPSRRSTDGYPVGAYRFGPPLPPDTTVLVESTIGCSNACHFCSWGRPYVRSLPFSAVADDLETIYSQRIRPRRVWFMDSAFNRDQDRAMQIFRFMVSRGFTSHFTVFLDLSTSPLEEAFIEGLLAAHIDVVGIGVQSFDPLTLKAIGRHHDEFLFQENYRRLLAARGRSRFVLDLDLIYGLPRSNLSGFLCTLDLIWELSPDVIHAFSLQIFPGTILHKKRHRFSMVIDERYHLVESSDWLRKEIEKADLIALSIYSLLNVHAGTSYGPILRDGLARYCKVLGLRFSQIVAVWRRWVELRHGHTVQSLGQASKEELCLIAIDFYAQLSNYVESKKSTGSYREDDIAYIRVDHTDSGEV